MTSFPFYAESSHLQSHLCFVTTPSSYSKKKGTTWEKPWGLKLANGQKPLVCIAMMQNSKKQKSYRSFTSLSLIHTLRAIRQRVWEGVGLSSICVYDKGEITPMEKSSNFGNPTQKAHLCLVCCWWLWQLNPFLRWS